MRPPLLLHNESLSMTRALLVLVLACCSALMACGTVSLAAPEGEPKDMVTASDESAARKRARVRLELAGAYFARGQHTTALDEVKQALQVDPNLGEAYNLRGLIYAAMGDTTFAEDSFNRALQINPRDGDTMHNLAWYYCQNRRFEDAARLFNRALELPQYASAVRTLLARGVCEARAGRWPQAEATLTRAYEFEPNSAVIAVNLAEVLLRQGGYERARFYIKRVNAVAAQSTAQTLWLAARIEMKLGNREGANEYGLQLRNRFPQSRESSAFDRGQFDE
jgi:type IV pilus assembly protein PilF